MWVLLIEKYSALFLLTIWYEHIGLHHSSDVVLVVLFKGCISDKAELENCLFASSFEELLKKLRNKNLQ